MSIFLQAAKGGFDISNLRTAPRVVKIQRTISNKPVNTRVNQNLLYRHRKSENGCLELKIYFPAMVSKNDSFCRYLIANNLTLSGVIVLIVFI